ncbi:MAG: efflux RND transporter periplasmic adaptor subunit [Gemmatimonadaceae bacterium]|nr:efflux RND transporter periplasmic adaptor subunit [Gemmatimonadaceae bacterium]
MRLESGPQLSGELAAERSASVRAEVAGSVVETYVEAGQAVTAGQRLARIDATAINAAAFGAQSAVTSADAQAAQARREVERAETLNKAGAISDRDLENARNAATAATAQLANARAQAAAANKQLRSAGVVAPFTGIVAQRQVSAGDVVTPGTPLFVIVDPRSMRLQASIPAARLGEVKVGMPVHFTVTGYGDRRFEGKVTRIAPVADPATRQVQIIAAIPNAGNTLVGGLFADGRVASTARSALVVPATAVDQRGPAPVVTRLRNGRTEVVNVTLGIRDDARERYEVTGGIQRGDTLLAGAAMGIGNGVTVRVSAVSDRATTSSAAPATPARGN